MYGNRPSAAGFLVRSIQTELASRRTWRRSRCLVKAGQRVHEPPPSAPATDVRWNPLHQRPAECSRAPLTRPRAGASPMGLPSLLGTRFVGWKYVRPSFTGPMSIVPSGRGPCGCEEPDLVPPAASASQPRAMPCPAGPGAVIPVKRTNAVTLTAMAPITEKIICHVADGVAIRTSPWVAAIAGDGCGRDEEQDNQQPEPGPRNRRRQGRRGCRRARRRRCGRPCVESFKCPHT